MEGLTFLKIKKKIIKIARSNQINLAFQSMLSTDKTNFNKKYQTSMKILEIIEKLKKKYHI